MARPLRIQFPDAMYHIMSRGIGRMTIFHNEKDWFKFMQFMERVIEKYNWICHAYCLMGTHYHILLETPDANMVVGMKYLNQLYSQFYNWKYQRVGPVLQGRYKAWLVEKEEKFLENSRYIVNNPTEAKMVEHPSQWPWSSYRAMTEEVPVPKRLAVDGLLSQFGAVREESRRRYQHFVLDGVGQGIWEGLRQQIYLGDEKFVDRMQAKAQVDGDALTVPLAQRRPPAPSLADIAATHKERNAAIVAAYATGAYSYREIAGYFNVHLATVGRIVRGKMLQHEN